MRKNKIIYAFTLAVCIFFVPLSLAAAKGQLSEKECDALLLAEAKRIEQGFQKTVDESNAKLDKIFSKENFSGDEEKMLMTKGLYMAFFKKKYQDAILKIQVTPLAYKKAAEADAYPKSCDKPEEMKKVSDTAVSEHAKIWKMAVEDAKIFAGPGKKNNP